MLSSNSGQVQEALWERADKAVDGRSQIPIDQAAEFLEKESQDLKTRYRPQPDTIPATLSDQLGGLVWDTKKKELHDIQNRCAEFDITGLGDASLHEEQERVLMIELEEEPMVTREELVTPYQPDVHPAVRYFVQTDHIDAKYSGFRPVFETLGNTSVAAFFDTKG